MSKYATHARKMLNNRVNLYPVSIYALLACLTYLGSDRPGNFGAACFVATCVFAGLAAASFWNWVADAWVAVYSAKRLADASSKEIRLAETLAHLTPEQLDLFKQLSRASMDESYSDLLVDGIPIPDDFIRELIAGSRGASLIPERTYSEGSKERMWYKTLASFWERQGVLVSARGNQPAQILDWHKALELINAD